MIDLIALALAIFLLLQLTRVRAFLSFVFDPMRMRRIAAPRIPEAFADLHAEATLELQALGFEGPIWYLLDSPDSSVLAQPVAAWIQREHGDVVWLFGPSPPSHVNRLVTVFARRLADGRHCLSQAFDCYAEILANPQVLAQTVGGADFAAQWQQHRDWCAKQGDVADSAADAADLEFQSTGLWQQRIASLVERGKVYRDSKGLLRPTLAFAWQMYAAFRRQPKPPASTRSVPPARLAWLAQVQQRQTQRPVPRRVQAGLFAFSVALFLILGGWFWGLRFSVILFVVVGIHEFGHYLAMRLSGYRNVQMLALPLVGGVTIGHEAKPDAARRAWMSLMGPLPGIVIGWVLLGVWLFGGMNDNPLLFEAALVFLSLNYLNVVPVPPLDGAHVVQELLPVGSARLSAVFIAIASVVGAALAFWFGFKLLAFIALLQLPLVRTRWQLGGVLRALRGDPQMQSSQPAMQRQQRMFEVFDRIAGTTAVAPTRLALGAEAMRSIDVKPMRWLQRLFVGGTYAALLAGPVLAGVVAMGLVPFFAVALSAAGDANKYQQRFERYEIEVAKLDVAGLLRGIVANEARLESVDVPALAAPTDAATVAAAQARLGLALPDDLLALYRVADGVKSLGVLQLADVHPVAEDKGLDMSSYAYEGTIDVFATDGTLTEEAPPRRIELQPRAAQNFLVIANDRTREVIVLYDAGEPPLNAGTRVYEFQAQGAYNGLPSLMSWLRRNWVHAALGVESENRLSVARERERAAVADLSALRLLDEIDRPGFFERRIAPQMTWGEPASDADIGAVAARFGAPLPEDIAEIYRRHDGIPMLALLPLARWQAVPTLSGDVAAGLRRRLDAGKPEADIATLDHCVVFSGHHFDPDAMAIELPEEAKAELPSGLQSANALWCPQATADRRIVDLMKGTFRRSYTEILRERVVQQRVSDAEME